MREVVISKGQSLIDVCIQEYGVVTALVQLAKDNDLSIDAELTAGMSLKIDDSLSYKDDVVSYLSTRGIKVNTNNDG